MAKANDRTEGIRAAMGKYHGICLEINQLMERRFPEGCKVYFRRGNMAAAAPATVKWARFERGRCELRVLNLQTSVARTIDLDDVTAE